MVASLPQMALWVLIGFWAYKVVVVGSIYGLIRFCVAKLHNYMTSEKIVKFKVAGCNPINEEIAVGLNNQIARLCGNYTYIHADGVEKLRKAIDIVLKDEGK